MKNCCCPAPGTLGCPRTASLLTPSEVWRAHHPASGITLGNLSKLVGLIQGTSAKLPNVFFGACGFWHNLSYKFVSKNPSWSPFQGVQAGIVSGFADAAPA